MSLEEYHARQRANAAEQRVTTAERHRTEAIEAASCALSERSANLAKIAELESEVRQLRALLDIERATKVAEQPQDRPSVEVPSVGDQIRAGIQQGRVVRHLCLVDEVRSHDGRHTLYGRFRTQSGTWSKVLRVLMPPWERP